MELAKVKLISDNNLVTRINHNDILAQCSVNWPDKVRGYYCHVHLGIEVVVSGNIVELKPVDYHTDFTMRAFGQIENVQCGNYRAVEFFLDIESAKNLAHYLKKWRVQ